MFRLVIQDDEGKTTVVPLVRDELTIGRKEGNTIRLTERNVSRKHARLLRENESIAIEDLGSYNGVRVNGTRIAGKASIRESDRVQIGDYLIELQLEKVAATNGQVAAPIAVEDSAAVATTRLTAPMNVVADSTQPLGNTAISSPAVATATTADAAETASTPARLVVLSSNFAGLEFSLAKPITIIGRTDDNDVAVNHRSISRNHAKLVRENGRFAIVDLQSSNGVRVNGEEYSKVELRRGDLIDLGHVRMRFVEPGEDFMFGRDAHAVDVESIGSSRWLWMGLGLVFVVGLVGMILWKSQKGEDAGQAAGNLPADAAVAVATAIKDAAPTTPTVPAWATRLTSAQQAVAGEKWPQALTEARAVLALDPTNVDAKAIEKQASAETQNYEWFTRLEQAAGKNQQAAVMAAWAKLDPTSVYREKAQALAAPIRDKWLVEKRAEAKKLAEKARCGDLATLIAEVEKVLGTTAKAELGNLSCEIIKKEKPSPGSSPTEPELSVDELIDQVRGANTEGQYGKALGLCRKVISRRPSDSTALSLCAIAACRQKNASLAQSYIQKLPAGLQASPKSLCLSSGVEIE